MKRTLSTFFVVGLVGAALAALSLGTRDAGAHSDRPRHHGDAGMTTTTTLSDGSTTTTTLPPCAQAFAPVDSALGALIDEIDAEQLSPRLQHSLTHFVDATARLEDAAAQAGCDHERHKRSSLLKAAVRTMIAFEYRVRSLAGRHGGANAQKLLALADAVLQALRSLKNAL